MGEEFVERVRLRAVDVDLAEHRKADAVVHLAELADFVRAAGLLRTELVAGKAENGEALGMKLLVELLQPLILRREPAFARGVDDEKNLAAIIGQVHVFARKRLGGEIVDAAQPAMRPLSLRRWACCG